MTGQELIDECRTRLRDTATPQFWTDANILQYLVQAEILMAEKSYVLLNFTDYTVTATTAATSFELDAVVQQVLAVQDDASGLYLTRYNTNYNLVFLTSTGTPTHYFVVQGKPLRIGFYIPTDATRTYNLVVAIKPEQAFTTGTEPQIPSEYHLDLVEYAVSKCMEHAEVDAYDPAIEQRAKDNWGMALVRAKRDVYRIQFGPNTIASPTTSWTGGK